MYQRATRRIGTSGLSQPEKLATRMAAAGLKHGQRVRANLRRACIDKDGIAYFCDVGEVEVLEVLGEGDAEPLPTQDVAIEGLDTLQAGYVDLLDVELCANDRLQIIGRADTVVRATRWIGAPAELHR